MEGTKLAIVHATVKGENDVGEKECGQCRKVFAQKELHLQEAMAISDPIQIENRVVGEYYYTFPNLFIKSCCPHCGFCDDKEKQITIAFKLPKV